MISHKHLRVLCHLRKDARMPLTKMSRKTGIPVSTLFERIRTYQDEFIIKHTSIIDFQSLGYAACANIMVKVDKEQRKELGNFLSKQENINTLYKVNNGYDFLFESVFTTLKETEDFIEKLEERFNIAQKQVFYITENLKKEGFMEDEIFYAGN